MIIHKLQLLFEILQVPLAALPLIQVLELQQRLQRLQQQLHQSLILIVVIMILIKEDVINALPFTI